MEGIVLIISLVSNGLCNGFGTVLHDAGRSWYCYVKLAVRVLKITTAVHPNESYDPADCCWYLMLYLMVLLSN